MYWAYTTHWNENLLQNVEFADLRWIFEDRFIFEEGVYRAYTTDEKRNIYRKDAQSLPTAGGAAPTEGAAAESAKRPARTAAAGITAGGT